MGSCPRVALRVLAAVAGCDLELDRALFCLGDEPLQIQAGVARQSRSCTRWATRSISGLALRVRKAASSRCRPVALARVNPLLGQACLDRLGAAAEHQGDLARHAVELEGAVAARHDGVAELGGAHRQGLLVALARLLGVDVEADAVDAAPLLIRSDRGVHDHGMAVQLWLGGA